MSKIKIIFATKNLGKVEELKNLLIDNQLNKLELISLNALNGISDIKEDGKTFFDNALIKASAVFQKYKLPVLADDSGLIVEELGEPGIYSARYAGSDATDEANNLKLIEKVSNIKNRRCYFECALIFINEKGEVFRASGKCYGEIVTKPVGKQGFGYDPIFFLPEFNKTMAEISLEEKNEISHRGKAFKKIVKILRGLYG